jgi:hypothetical protein
MYWRIIMSDRYKLEYTNIRCGKYYHIFPLHKPIDLTKTAYEEMVKDIDVN